MTELAGTHKPNISKPNISKPNISSTEQAVKEQPEMVEREMRKAGFNWEKHKTEGVPEGT